MADPRRKTTAYQPLIDGIDATAEARECAGHLRNSTIKNKDKSKKSQTPPAVIHEAAQDSLPLRVATGSPQASQALDRTADILYAAFGLATATPMITVLYITENLRSVGPFTSINGNYILGSPRV